MMPMAKCNKFDRYPVVMFSIILVQLCTAELLFVHHPVAIKHAGFVSSFSTVFVLCIFSYLFVAGNFPPVSEFFQGSSFQTFMIEKGVYLLVDWFYNRRRSFTIDHLDIYKHIYHRVVVFSISVKYCLRVRRVFHFITWRTTDKRGNTSKHFTSETEC